MVAPNAEWSVEWGGSIVTAPSAFDVLATLGELSYVAADAKYPKRGISFRVWTQYQIIIDPELTDEAFLIALAENGIVSLTITGTSPDDRLQEAQNFAASFHQELDTD